LLINHLCVYQFNCFLLSFADKRGKIMSFPIYHAIISHCASLYILYFP